MHGAGALESLGDVAQLAFAVLADCVGRIDVTESHRDLCGRPRLERLATAQFAFYRPAAFARWLFHHHTKHPFFATPFRHRFMLLQQHDQPTFLRRAEGRMPSAWRYLATVRRAILIWSR